MVKARKYVVKKYFEGFPKREDFEIIEYNLPDLQDDEVLIKVEWVSVDPYMRLYNSVFPVPYDQFGFIAGHVIESKNLRYTTGMKVVAHNGWCDYFIINPDVRKSDFDVCYSLPDFCGLPFSLAVGALGPVGATAYFGFLSICDPKEDETVVITTAAGAVGSLVGQIAKLKGCRVIGYTGTDEKVKWLEELGFDKAFNYNKIDLAESLREAAPNGVDCYFDNVGGEMSSIIMHQMNEFGRISACGSISAYNEDLNKLPKVPQWQVNVIKKQLKIEGFLVFRWLDQWPIAFNELLKWIKNGDLKIKEHITYGFDNIYDAFMDVLTGKNIGKAIVQI